MSPFSNALNVPRQTASMTTADSQEQEQEDRSDRAGEPERALCADCLALMAETRFIKGPHPYLVAAGLDQGSLLQYRCLLCRGTLVYTRATGHWSAGTAGAGPTQA